jgi:phospholipid/cholesterol/gamma-HCH transport system ATP-binding protein
MRPRSRAAAPPGAPAAGPVTAVPAVPAAALAPVPSPAPGNGVESMVHLDHVTMAFGDRIVLDAVDLKVPRGKITVVMGGSGSGKSTILKLIVGFIFPSAGKIWIDRQDVLKLTRDERVEVQKSIGMSFQYSALFDSMTVFDNVAFPLREHTPLPEPQIRERVIAMLERLGLPGIEDKMPSDLSGGMKKRVGVARAIMLQPKIMLFDEPESGLDPITTTSIAELIMEMRDSFHITCLVISHNLQSTRLIADKVCMLYKGRIIAEGTPAELDANPDPVLQQFLNGSSKGPY